VVFLITSSFLLVVMHVCQLITAFKIIVFCTAQQCDSIHPEIIPVCGWQIMVNIGRDLRSFEIRIDCSDSIRKSIIFESAVPAHCSS